MSRKRKIIFTVLVGFLVLLVVTWSSRGDVKEFEEEYWLKIRVPKGWNITKSLLQRWREATYWELIKVVQERNKIENPNYIKWGTVVEIPNLEKIAKEVWKLEEKDREIRELRGKVVKLMVERDGLEKEAGNLEKENARLLTELRNREKQISFLELGKEELNKKIRGLIAENNSLKEEITTLKEEFSRIETRRAEAEKLLESIREENQSLKEALGEERKKIETLNKENGKLSERVIALQGRVQKLSDEIKEKEKAISVLVREREKFQEEIKSINQKTPNLKEEIANLKKELNAREKKIAELIAENKELKYAAVWKIILIGAVIILLGIIVVLALRIRQIKIKEER